MGKRIRWIFLAWPPLSDYCAGGYEKKAGRPNGGLIQSGAIRLAWQWPLRRVEGINWRAKTKNAKARALAFFVRFLASPTDYKHHTFTSCYRNNLKCYPKIFYAGQETFPSFSCFIMACEDCLNETSYILPANILKILAKQNPSWFYKHLDEHV